MSLAIPCQSHRNLPHKARISIFNGKKELETFINDSQSEKQLLDQSQNLSNKRQYILGCQSIYEKFSMKKGFRASSFSLNEPLSQSIVSLKRIK